MASRWSRQQWKPQQGTIKKTAGKRSGLKRKAKTLLVIKSPWLDMILDGKKGLEIRGAATNKRGWIHLALSGSGGAIVGRAKLFDSFEIHHAKFNHYVARHCVSDLEEVRYTRIYAWVRGAYSAHRVGLHPMGAYSTPRGAYSTQGAYFTPRGGSTLGVPTPPLDAHTPAQGCLLPP